MLGKGNEDVVLFGSRVITVVLVGFGLVWVVDLPNGMLGLRVLF